MKSGIFNFSVQIYYEDTDHSGVVYHANYLKYFERAREDIIGIENLIDLWKNKNLGFAVYKVDIVYHEGAEFGDHLKIKSQYEFDGKYRLIWNQTAWRLNSKKPAVDAVIHLVCISKDKKLVPIPDIKLPLNI